MLQGIHHIAIICSDINRSKAFYTKILGLEIVHEIYRAERSSWKIDLSLNGNYMIELFSFLNAPKRLSFPEAQGLRHLAFKTDDIEAERERIISLGIDVEEIREDEFTGKHFCFFLDPDSLPIELYEN